MISRLLLPSAVRLATYSRVRGSRLIRARQTMYSARLASRLPPRLRRWRTTFPEEASTGDTPQRLAKEASLLNLWGLSLRPRSVASRRGRYRCLPKRPAPGRLASPADRAVCVQLGDLCRESLVSASHRTERELPGCRQYLMRVISETEACSHG